METTSYGEAWRAFWKQNFGLCSTTYYSTVPITCTQTRIHRTQLLHYGKLLQRSSLPHNIYHYNELRCYDISWWYIVLLCEISLQWSLARTISRRDITDYTDISMIYRFNIRQSMWCFADISVLNHENKARYLLIIVCITFTQYCKWRVVEKRIAKFILQWRRFSS